MKLQDLVSEQTKEFLKGLVFATSIMSFLSGFCVGWAYGECTERAIIDKYNPLYQFGCFLTVPLEKD